MANIDLSRLFKKQQEIVSEVDTNIKFNQPQNVNELYSDYKLDLNFDLCNIFSLYKYLKF